MTLRDDILNWLVHWNANPEKVISILNKIKFVETQDKNDYFSFLLVAASAAKSYGITKDELRLAIRQVAKLVYDK